MGDSGPTSSSLGSVGTAGIASSARRTIARALFVTDSDEDYAAVFQIFDRDATGGIDPFEFRAIMALLGEHSTVLRAITGRLGGKHALLLEHAAQAAAAAQQAQLDWELQHLSAELQRSGG